MLNWNVLLSPHHCSKKVMYEGNVLHQDAMDELQTPQLDIGYIVASSPEFPAHRTRPVTTRRTSRRGESL